MDKRSLLKSCINKITQLEDCEFDAICDSIEICSYDKKVRITDIGCHENNIYWVANGLVVKYFYKGKYELVTEIANQGDVICSSISFLNQTPSGCVVETIEQSTLYSLSRQNIGQLCDTYPGLQKLYANLIAEAFIRSDQRNKDKLIYKTKDLFARFMNENKSLLLRLPQKFIASYLNIKPETFSRFKNTLTDIHRKKYQKDRVIEFDD